MFGFLRKKAIAPIAIGAIFRNEKDYILEWIAWHQSQGIDKFIIYDNESDDGTFQLLELLQKHAVIDLYSIERQDKVQIIAYEKILSQYKNDVELMTFIDADEFLVPYGELRVIDHINDLFSDKSVGGLALNWRNYGTSGHLNQLDGFVIDRFTQAASDQRLRNHYIKSVYRPKLVKDIYPHRAVLENRYRYINSSGDNAVFATYDRCIKPIPSGATSGVTDTICDMRIRVHHYALKSHEEFTKKKKYRGSSMFGAGLVKSDGYFKEFDLNDIELPVNNNLHYSLFREKYARLLNLIGLK
ncbi:glycosyltransferase family 92 protein [Amphritea japonica]|uniref:Glycosyl transferase family 2 n=1 Tax=Amphritea japonica ATCC BAA-1530 TaxID=1278309 RepID=A0A7R6SRX1_9GAMM|nr:glycosyltransferase family 92 protein [Amphritea japonica]BBB25591.1 glycosyl transferase family 2 [Amphritea japonica ATCC BAA-1530]